MCNNQTIMHTSYYPYCVQIWINVNNKAFEWLHFTQACLGNLPYVNIKLPRRIFFQQRWAPTWLRTTSISLERIRRLHKFLPGDFPRQDPPAGKYFDRTTLIHCNCNCIRSKRMVDLDSKLCCSASTGNSS